MVQRHLVVVVVGGVCDGFEVNNNNKINRIGWIKCDT